MIRPNIKLPLWVALALPAAAYVVRSLMRGGDFTPDLPGDAIAYGLLIVVVVAVGLARARANAPDDGDDESADQVDGENRTSREKR